MPHLDLDPSTFDACAAAARDAAGGLHVAAGPAVPPGATGDGAMEAALADLRHAWARDVGLLGAQLEGIAAALAGAGRVLATAEGDVVGALSALPAPHLPASAAAPHLPPPVAAPQRGGR